MQLNTNILVVEDENLFRKSLGRLINRLGHRVTTVSSAEEALELTKSSTFDLILTDIRLPGITGLELLETLKKSSFDSAFIVMTGCDTPENSLKAKDLKVDDYLLKPLNKEVLKKAIDKGIEKKFLAKSGGG